MVHRTRNFAESASSPDVTIAGRNHTEVTSGTPAASVYRLPRHS